MADTLTATDLTISRGGRLLVDGLDLSLKEGTVTALTGPNGSGPPANRFISKRARARSAGALPKPARPKTPPAKHHPNQPAPRRRRQNAAQTHKTAP